MSKTIILKENGYDPGTWEESKQLLMEGWIADSISSNDTDPEDLEIMANIVLDWVCDQLGIEEYEIAQGK